MFSATFTLCLPISTDRLNNYFWILTRIVQKCHIFILAYYPQAPMCGECLLKILAGITIVPTPAGVHAGILTSSWCHSHLWHWPAKMVITLALDLKPNIAWNTPKYDKLLGHVKKSCIGNLLDILLSQNMAACVSMCWSCEWRSQEVDNIVSLWKDTCK